MVLAVRLEVFSNLSALKVSKVLSTNQAVDRVLKSAAGAESGRGAGSEEGGGFAAGAGGNERDAAEAAEATRAAMDAGIIPSLTPVCTKGRGAGRGVLRERNPEEEGGGEGLLWGGRGG